MSYPYQNPYGSTYYSPGGTSSPYGNQQPQATAFVPGAGALNFTNFHSNTQSQPPAPSFPFSTASFPPEVLKQFANSNLPPPPPGFPPVPPLNLNFPPFPPPPVALNQGQSYSPSQHNAQDEIEDAYDPHFPQSILQNSRPSTIGRSQSTQNQNQDLAQTALEKGGRFDLAQLLPNLDGACSATATSYAHANVLKQAQSSPRSAFLIPSPRRPLLPETLQWVIRYRR